MGLHARNNLTCGTRRKSKAKFLKKINPYLARKSVEKSSHSGSSQSGTVFSDCASEIEELPDLTVETESITPKGEAITGRRIVDLFAFLLQLKSLKHEGFNCSFFDMTLIAEKRMGLKSLLTFECEICKKKETVSTDGEGSKNINSSAVCGAISVGIGHTQLSELCSALDIPPMSSKTYLKYQQEVETSVDETFCNEMLLAGAEEARLAMEAGDVCPDGVPFTTVIVDGAWAKRSYKTNYNAQSGVGCIIGARTKKVLYVGIKNKYCLLCQKYKSQSKDIPEHKCSKNWSGTSTSMESAIILDGFKVSVKTHNLRYLRFIGDGDSSVYKKLKENKCYGPQYFIEKIECRNHILRNFCRRIKELSNRPKLQPQLKTFLRQNILRFRAAIVGAVRYRKKQKTQMAKKIQDLKMDLINGPQHIFGDHQNCVNEDGSRKYFCSGVKPGELNNYTNFKNSLIFEEFQAAVMRVVNNASSLLVDVDNNSVENYNSIVNKLVGGKRINFCLRASYAARCKAAAISYNNRGAFIDIVQKSFDGGEVGNYTNLYAEKARNRVRTVSKRKPKTIYNEDEDYGATSEEIFSDKSEYELVMAKNSFLLEIAKVDRAEVLKNSLGQSTNPVWQQERSNRITASNFGTICKMRPSTNTASLVKNVLNNSKQIKAKSLEYGIIKEEEAKQRFIKAKNLQVRECGLFIDAEYPFIGASPDGLIGEDTVLEIKCPYTAKDCTTEEAVEQKKITYLVKSESHDKLKLKSNHNYMYQIQGQLHVSRRKFCYFVVYTLKDLFIQKICYNHDFWLQYMEKRLINFYLFALLPEIVDSRQQRNRPLRQIRCKDIID